MKIAHVISDGTPRGTTVLDDQGNELTNIKSIEWKLEAMDSLATVKIEFGMVNVSLKGSEQSAMNSNPIVPQPLTPQQRHDAMNSITMTNHGMAIGEWLMKEGKLYKICKPINQNSFTIKRVYWPEVWLHKALDFIKGIASEVREAVSTKPTDALDRFENEVIERCALVAGHKANMQRLADAQAIVEAIRALKKEVK